MYPKENIRCTVEASEGQPLSSITIERKYWQQPQNYYN